ncbi:MAG TPA: hypothetical protein VFG14_03500 [Chthoniobacteraceae bacterium]|nr:hypothetical protein [Chthoniobacteraceae bacterium]
MKSVLTALALFIAAGATFAGPLETATLLRETQYAGWKYGPSAAKQEVDCVQFVASVVQKEIGRDLTPDERNAIYINPPPADLSAAVESEQPATKGIQYALVDVLKRGIAVAPEQAQPGDFIQYWIRKKDGKWAGHSAIISRVFEIDGTRRIAIYGSHKITGGIADTDFGGQGVKLTGADRKVYIARLQ